VAQMKITAHLARRHPAPGRAAGWPMYIARPPVPAWVPAFDQRGCVVLVINRLVIS